MGSLLEPLYYGVSWVLLRWHWLWETILPEGTFLGTDWDWILAIICLAATVRLVLYPLFVIQVRNTRAIRVLAPKIKELQETYKDDPVTLRMETMRLYQSAKVNPFLGCLPWIVQLPIFFALIHVLRWLDPDTPVARDLYGWSVEQFDSAATAQFLGAPIWASLGDGDTRARIVAGVLVVLVALSFLVAFLVGSPDQRRQAEGYIIPALVLLAGWAIPVGLSLYFLAQGLVVIALQRSVRHP